MSDGNGKTCSVASCNRPVFYKNAGLCQTCYNGMYYWKGKTPTQILKRHAQLEVLQDRMDLPSHNRRPRR